VTTLAGAPGAANGGLQFPRGVAVDDAGNVYVADTGNHVVRKVTPAGAMSIVAGQVGRAGFAPGSLPGLLDTPTAVAVVGTDLYVAMPVGIAVVHNRP
jgi:DNA-binding beta-propeller fold protein YncE